MRQIFVAASLLFLALVLCFAAPAGAAPPSDRNRSTDSDAASVANSQVYLPFVANQPAPPPTPSFGYGVQVDPGGSTTSNIGHIQALGFGWMKVQVAWKDIEPNPGDYRWSGLDSVVNGYSASGIRVLLSVVKAPNWARPANTNYMFDGPPADPQTYADFMTALLARYEGRVAAIEVWNEQNLWYQWGGETLDAARYVDLLCTAAGAIRSVAPSVLVISGAPTPTGLNDGKNAITDQVYVQQMYAAGGKTCFDALGAHPSGYNNPPDAVFGYTDPAEPTFKGHPSFFFRSTLEGYRATMVANSDSGKKIWATEIGWASDPNPLMGFEYARDNTLDEQAAYLTGAFQLARSWGWVGGMIVWNLDYGVWSHSEMAYFSLLRPGPMPAYAALQGMPK